MEMNIGMCTHTHPHTYLHTRIHTDTHTVRDVGEGGKGMHGLPSHTHKIILWKGLDRMLLVNFGQISIKNNFHCNYRSYYFYTLSL